MIEKINGIQTFFSSHILLYHSSYSSIPSKIKNGLHNVCPEIIYKQISWLKQNFDVVDVDSLFGNKRIEAGKVAITFDDAYQSVFTEALPVIESLKIPCTIFVSGVTLNGKPFWRDKIRLLMNRSLVQSFIGENIEFCCRHCITQENFYNATKSPKVNSKEMDDLLDQFIINAEVSLDEMIYCINKTEYLSGSPYVKYGNHSYNHYVLSSLSKEQQKNEIRANDKVLKNLGLNASKVFSVPFGGDKQFNLDTIEILKDLNYKGYLFSRNAINVNKLCGNGGKERLLGLERYMAPSSYASFHRKILKLGIKGAISSIM